MECVIINNFENFPTQPPVYTPYISGLLANSGFKCNQIDLNLEVWDYLLNTDNIKKLEYNEIWKLYAERLEIPIINNLEFLKLKSYLIQSLLKSIQVYKDENQFFDIHKLAETDSILKKVQYLFYYNYGIYIRQQRTIFAIDNDLHFFYSRMNNFAENEVINPFISIFTKIIKNQVKDNTPKLFLIESMFSWQFPYLVTLNKVIKKLFPNCHICFTGFGFDQVAFVRIKDSLKMNQLAFLGFDSIFLVRNDNAIVDFCYNILHNMDIDNIPSLAIKKANTIINEPYFEQYSDKRIIPDFSNFELSRYFSPYPVVIEKFSNRCFWSNCNYCSINFHKGKNVSLSESEFTERIEKYFLYGFKYIFLLDEAATYEQVKSISSIFEKSRFNFYWSIRTRIDKNLDFDLLSKMYNNGCRELWIGLESVSPRVLKLMNKTDNTEQYLFEVDRIIKDCYKIGIGLHFCLLFGFPGETIKDHEMLLLFFQKNKLFFTKMPLFISFNEFSLSPYSYVYKNPDKFKITILTNDSDRCYIEQVPYIDNNFNEFGKQEFQKSINNTINSISTILSNNRFINLWNSVTDTCYEMILKTHFQEKNPFLF